MSYADRKSDNNQKALTGTLVAVIQAGVVLALINGFAVTVLEKEPAPRTVGEQIKLDPIPPEPSPEPAAKPAEPVISDPVRVAKLPLDSNQPVDLTTPKVVVPTGGSTGIEDPQVPLVRPEPQPPRFAPKSARPGNDAASWVTESDYPARELRAGHQGDVRFRLAIDERGRVGQCTIIASSGYPALDQAACKFISKRARFEPATNGDGGAVPGTYSGTIRWVIPRD